ncbi:collagen-like triple helix repeat-containing protein [Niabella sp. 22666]|uniref:collagen-like triple helix repeat-containing protein n=1 Tax=Niabella sp. 22666 TaxID=3453954 RepID=UPI003F83ADC5
MRRSFLSVLVLASLIVGVESCKKGDTGPAGPAGPTGAQGTPGAAGTKGADGTIIKAGATAPTGNVNDFWLNTSTGVLYGPKTSTNGDSNWPTTGINLRGANGATGANGTNGTNGATGAAGANGATGATGATGAAGASFIAGPNAPTGGQGKDGDTYFATGTSTLYGPKTGGAWPATGTAIGVTATPRVFFLDVTLGGGTEFGKISTSHDTALVVDTDRGIIASSQTLNRVDIEQRAAHYAGWSSFNGREILFTDVALTNTNQLYMVPTQNSDLNNTVNRTFVYTKDPRNAKYVAIIRRAGQLAGLAATTNPANPLPATAQPNPVIIPTSGVPYAGGGLRYGVNAPVSSAAVHSFIGQAIADLGLTASDATPVLAYTFSVDDSIRLTSSTTGAAGTYNNLCYWMYSEISHSDGSGTANINNKNFVINGLVDFFTVWKKAAPVSTGDFADYDVKKTINLNTLANNNLGAAWTAARKSGSIDFKFMYATPTGHGATSGLADQSSINPALTHGTGTLVPSVTGAVGLRQYAPGAVTITGPFATNSTTGAPVVPAAASYSPFYVQNLYNTWISLDDAGALGNPGSTIGSGAGSGAANDYSLENGAHGDVYFLTPPAYEFGTFAAYNGGTAFNVVDPVYGTYNVPAPSTTNAYPYTGIWLQNGYLQVNYRVYNGGTTLRNVSAVPAPSVFNGTTGADAYSYNWTGPKGYIANAGTANGTSQGGLYPGASGTAYWPLAATATTGSYFDGPWPSNQNTACQGYYFSGKFIPVGTKRPDDVIIKLKIQTIPSSNPTDAPIVLKAGGQVK